MQIPLNARLYASLVVFTAGLVPEEYRLLYVINPMIAVVEDLERHCLVNNHYP